MNIRLRTSCVSAIAALACHLSLSYAQDVGTYDVYFQQISTGGQLEGCSLVFTAIVNDTAYLAGKPVVVNGSLAIRTLQKKNVFLAGKLGTRVLSDNNSWTRPEYFFFASANGTTASTATITNAETPGYKLLLAELDPKVMAVVSDMAKLGKFDVGFNRKKNGQDVIATIDIAKSLQKNASGEASIVDKPETARDFFSCFRKLADVLK